MARVHVRHCARAAHHDVFVKQLAVSHPHSSSPSPHFVRTSSALHSDEEEIRIEELIKSVDLSTVCIPIGTRARVVKANLANVQAGATSMRRSLRQVRLQCILLL